MTPETLHQLIAIVRRIRGLSVPAGTDYGHGEIADLSKEVLGLLEAAEDKDEVVRLRRLNENQARALDHWRRLSDVDGEHIRALDERLRVVQANLNDANERLKSIGEAKNCGLERVSIAETSPQEPNL